MFTKLKKSLKKSDEGFTIIEVMIVLAIAGLILLIVFLAVPALQRNSRNTQRKNDAATVAGLISEYSSNNNGALPAVACLSGSTVTIAGGTCAAPTNGVTGSLGGQFTQINGAAGGAALLPTPAAAVSGSTTNLALYANTQCANNQAAAGAANRQVAVLYAVEPGAVSQCTTT